MRQDLQDQYNQVIKHLYISPLEACNLGCKVCYTKKTADKLSSQVILDFVTRYRKVTDLQSVLFCGGEVFILPDFVDVVNQLTAGDNSVLVQIISNGTIDKLGEFTNPNRVNLIISIDGIESEHDRNRGIGNYQKTVAFGKKALEMGFHLEIFSIVTAANKELMDDFEIQMNKAFGSETVITYHPRKPMTYLTAHPISNRIGETENFGFVDWGEISHKLKVKGKKQYGVHRRVFPPSKLGCFQIAVMSNGLVYGCCEGVRPLGRIEDKVESLLQGLRKRLEDWEKVDVENKCLGCVEPNFVCGIKSEVLGGKAVS